MRLLAALVVVVLVLIVPAGVKSLSGPGIIRVTATTIREFTRHGDRVTVSLIYNKAITFAAIGNAILSCDFVGQGGPLSSGTWICEAEYSLDKGRISASGLIKAREYYLMSITGGTGIYSNVRGQIVVSTIGTSPRRERLLFGVEI